jgi:hypothetical protein
MKCDLDRIRPWRPNSVSMLPPNTIPSFPDPQRQGRKPATLNCAIPQPRPAFIVFSHASGHHRRGATYLSCHGYVVAAMNHSEVVAPEPAYPPDETAEQKTARLPGVIGSRVPDIRFRSRIPSPWVAALFSPGRNRFLIFGAAQGLFCGSPGEMWTRPDS